ncbi:MAG: lytic murein transglycosylase B [Gammaproteobacteria bacterium]|nr:MAG: lytic murein transglycosylase B [Gammaproteobacteria bacterium]
MKLSHLVSLILACAVSAAVQASYLEHPRAQAFMQSLIEKDGFDEADIKRWLAAAERQQKILDAIARPAERVLEWKDYRKIFVTEDRIRKGRDFMKAQMETLDRAEHTFGVPARIITAIIGVETRYGRHRGGYRVLDALSTLAFDYPPRSAFFEKELRQFLLMTREQNMDPLMLKGSYAGAMGFGQFIPSSYRRYAVDFDGDGIADILDNVTDAIGSVANYFVEHGWQTGKPVAVRVQPAGAVPEDLLPDKQKPVHSVGDLMAAGVPNPLNVPADLPARLIRLEGADGPEYWMTFHNFYVITRYNHSDMYAMAVYQLSEAF